MMNALKSTLAAVALSVVSSASVAQTIDRYVGYYYPEVTSTEVFDRMLQVTPPANHDIRIEFVTMLTLSQRDAPFPARYTAFAKGSDADTLIIVALQDEVFKTLYRARAAMARVTSNIRATDFFMQQGLQFDGTFYDMLQILEFKRLILTDGETWSHEVRFVRPEN